MRGFVIVVVLSFEQFVLFLNSLQLVHQSYHFGIPCSFESRESAKPTIGECKTNP